MTGWINWISARFSYFKSKIANRITSIHLTRLVFLCIFVCVCVVLYRLPAYGCQWLLRLLGVSYDLRGIEHIQREHGNVVLINHQSSIDLCGKRKFAFPIFRQWHADTNTSGDRCTDTEIRKTVQRIRRRFQFTIHSHFTAARIALSFFPRFFSVDWTCKSWFANVNVVRDAFSTKFSTMWEHFTFTTASHKIPTCLPLSAPHFTASRLLHARKNL